MRSNKDDAADARAIWLAAQQSDIRRVPLKERWLADPESLIPGQRMGYSLGDAAMRADVIAYLATLATAR